MKVNKGLFFSSKSIIIQMGMLIVFRSDVLLKTPERGNGIETDTVVDAMEIDEGNRSLLYLFFPKPILIKLRMLIGGNTCFV